MTLRGLINKLEKIEKEIGPRATVCVNLAEYRIIAQQNDFFSHWTIHGVKSGYIPWGDPDEGRFNKDGSEKYRRIVEIL